MKDIKRFVKEAEKCAGRLVCADSAHIEGDKLYVGFWPYEAELQDENQELQVSWSASLEDSVVLIPSMWHIKGLEESMEES